VKRKDIEAKSQRIYRLLYELAKGRTLRTSEVAQTFGVSRRTIERYVEELKMAGVPVFTSSGTLRLSSSLMIDYDYTLGLSAREKKVLLLISSLAEKYFGNAFSQHTENITLKIKESLNLDPFFYQYEELTQYYTILTPRRENVHIGVIETLEAAMSSRQVVRLSYRHPSDGHQMYIVEPYRLVFSDEHWFLFCRDIQRDCRFFLRVSRILHPVERLSRKFSMPAQSAIEKALSRVWGTHYADTEYTITVWFSSDVARIIKDTTRHPSQKIYENPDGSIYYTVYACGYREIISWVLSYGSKAKVIAPFWIAEEIAQEIERMHKLYRT
jgi:predicted DNA-binding transcriptional regulator YafY